MNAHSKALKIADEAGVPQNVDMIERQLVAKAHQINESAKRAARECNTCGSTVYVKGYDCFPCEVAFDAPVRNTGNLAAAIGRALELQIDAERGQ
jgi:hypothetical protein